MLQSDIFMTGNLLNTKSSFWLVPVNLCNSWETLLQWDESKSHGWLTSILTISNVFITVSSISLNFALIHHVFMSIMFMIPSNQSFYGVVFSLDFCFCFVFSFQHVFADFSSVFDSLKIYIFFTFSFNLGFFHYLGGICQGEDYKSLAQVLQ